MTNTRTNSLNHPIVEQSFAIIDQEVGEHNLSPRQYAIARRIIHTTADFDYLNLLEFRHDPINSALVSLKKGIPIVTDVTMVRQGIRTMVGKTFNNPIVSAIDFAETALPGKTRTETGLIRCWQKYPEAIYVIGNAPTALIALAECIKRANIVPPLLIGAPVGFVAVEESKQVCQELSVPQIVVKGRKGGSPVAAAIVNALLVMAGENGTSELDLKK